MLVCARLKYMKSAIWGQKKYMNMKHLESMGDSPSVAG